MPCLLCGGNHPVYFHAKIKRTFKYDFDGVSEKNFVYRIKCLSAKENGSQYTLTILPHMLLPGCLVRADDVFTAGMNKDIREDIDKACDTMGVKDDRTAKKHLERFDFCFEDFNKRLAGVISQSGEKLPEIKPCTGSPSDINKTWFEKLAPITISIREKLFGFEGLSLEDIAYLYFFFVHPSYPCATINANSKNIIFPIWLVSPPPDNVRPLLINHVRL